MSLQDNLFGVMEVFNLQACDTGILLVGWQVWKMLKNAARNHGGCNLGPVVRTPVSTKPGLNFNLAFFFLLSNSFLYSC